MTLTRQQHGDMRRGKLSGSRASVLMSGSYKAWNSLLKELRSPPPFYGVSARIPAPLRWGKQNEDLALARWWEKHPALDLLNPVCVSYHDPDDLLWSRHVVVSPDRVVYDPAPGKVIAGLELKCPHTEGLLERWRAAGVVPRDHVDQCAFGMLVMNLRRWQFVGFDPRVDEADQFFELPVVVEESYLAKMYEMGTRFLRVLESGGEFTPPPNTASALTEMFNGR